MLQVMTAFWNNQRSAGNRIRNDLAVQAVDLFHQSRCDDLGRASLGSQLSFTHGENVIRIPCRKVDVVEHHDNGGVAFPVQVCEKI